MAKYERYLEGNFEELLEWLHADITQGSLSASYEDGSDFEAGETKAAVRVYERYSMIGSNRVSMNVTLIGKGSKLFVSAITSGGSQAVFFKVNTISEEAFLESCIHSVEDYIYRQDDHSLSKKMKRPFCLYHIISSPVGSLLKYR